MQPRRRLHSLAGDVVLVVVHLPRSKFGKKAHTVESTQIPVTFIPFSRHWQRKSSMRFSQCGAINPYREGQISSNHEKKQRMSRSKMPLYLRRSARLRIRPSLLRLLPRPRPGIGRRRNLCPQNTPVTSVLCRDMPTPSGLRETRRPILEALSMSDVGRRNGG